MIGIWELLGHFANVMYSIGYAVRNALWLRLFLFSGCAIEVVYSLRIAENPLWVNIFWAGMGASLNGFQIGVLLRERRQFTMTTEENDLRQTIFRDLRVSDFRRLMAIARWVDLEPGTVLTVEGEPVQDLVLVQRGAGSVAVQGAEVAMVGAGHFVGEMSFFSGGAASATVRTLVRSRCVIWPKARLAELMEHATGLKSSMQSAFTADMVTKLIESNRQRAEAERRQNGGTAREN